MRSNTAAGATADVWHAKWQNDWDAASDSGYMH
jgi:hypothetical protein